MDCSICNKPVQLNEKFVSAFTPKPEHKYFISHAKCAAISDPLKIKTMSPLRLEALETYKQIMAKSAAETTPSAT
jgi:hypothetical protein